MRRQFWLGPHRAGQTVRFWASVDVIHLTIGGRAGQEPALTSQRRRSRPARRRGRRFGGPPPLPPAEDEAVIEVDRAVVNNSGLVGLAGKQVLAAEIVGGRPVIVRIEPQTLMFLDPETRELLKGRSQPAHARAGDPAAGRAARRPAAADRAGDRLSAASAPPV